jgi:hypothetical protein
MGITLGLRGSHAANQAARGSYGKDSSAVSPTEFESTVPRRARRNNWLGALAYAFAMGPVLEDAMRVSPPRVQARIFAGYMEWVDARPW